LRSGLKDLIFCKTLVGFKKARQKQTTPTILGFKRGGRKTSTTININATI
jgi:hypothetical protein